MTTIRYRNGREADYTVEALTDENADRVPYLLTGTRGATYYLFRNVHNPHHMFAVNGKGFAKTTLVEATVEGEKIVAQGLGEDVAVAIATALRERGIEAWHEEDEVG